DQPPAVGAERQADDQAGVTAEGVDRLARVAVPDSHGTILTARGDPPAVRAERQGVDLPIVSPEGGLEVLSGLYVPDFDRVLLTSRRQPTTIRAEGHVQTWPGEARAKRVARFLLQVEAHRVQEHHAPVPARRSQVPAVAAKDQCADIPFGE